MNTTEIVLQRIEKLRAAESVLKEIAAEFMAEHKTQSTIHQWDTMREAMRLLGIADKLCSLAMYLQPEPTETTCTESP